MTHTRRQLYAQGAVSESTLAIHQGHGVDPCDAGAVLGRHTASLETDVLSRPTFFLLVAPQFIPAGTPFAPMVTAMAAVDGVERGSPDVMYLLECAPPSSVTLGPRWSDEDGTPVRVHMQPEQDDPPAHVMTRAGELVEVGIPLRYALRVGVGTLADRAVGSISMMLRPGAGPGGQWHRSLRTCTLRICSDA